MYGRYGNDTLNKTLLWVYLALFIIYYIVLMIYPNPWIYIAHLILSTAIVVWSLFRSFSRNIAKRRAENQRFCNFWKLRRNKWRDRKTHVYRKCPKCHAVLRLPKARGKHTVSCPKCHNRFSVRG
jgi:hypothetical protein